MDYGWTYLKSGLGLREDQFSWQGSVESDPRFFLRQSKNEPEKITDLLLGDLPDDAVELLFAEFLRLSGGMGVKRIVFISISRQDDSHDATVAAFDRVVRIGKNVAMQSGRLTKKSYLDQDGNHWNAVLEFQTDAG